MGTTAAATSWSSRGGRSSDATGVSRQVFRLGSQRAVLEIRATSGGQQALILPGTDSDPLSAALVRTVTASLDQQMGSSIRVRSTALTEEGSASFVESGYAVHRRLHLLVLDVTARRFAAVATPVGVRLRRVPRRRRSALLGVDHEAFENDLWFDVDDLAGALRATPVVRLRLATLRRSSVGYAIFGRAGNHGYLQRLAVHPAARRRGIGRALLVDGIHWSAQRGVARIVVNTEHGNDPALRLYRSCGFVEAPIGLVIMERPPEKDVQ